MTTALENVFYQNTSIKTGVGCTIEYNMNSMIDGINVSTTCTDNQYEAGINPADGLPLKVNPFKKLFPVDSVVKPFRPLFPGVKYFIMLPADTTKDSFSNFRMVTYPGEGKNITASGAQPRVYYPGLSTYYKYWVSPKDVAADITVTYKQDSNPVTGNKYALANKIVVRFEKYHSLPANYHLVITPKTGSAITTSTISTPTTGEAIHYYNGTNWNTTSEPSSYSDPQEIKSIQLITSAPATGKVIGVIELSARWIKDISSDVVTLNIAKESSSNSQDILPVGMLTANSVVMDLLKYNESATKIVEYNREIASFDSSMIYIVKNAELKPHIKVYHSGAVTVAGDYDKVSQGIYYADSWSIAEFSETNLTALDGGKYLMETFAPDILAENYPVTAIIRRLLDTVGFTSYNFNLITNDTSIPTLTYWWTDDTATVWQHLQELCRDIQMNAVFDDDGILQFYSRDYLYTKSSNDWEFYFNASGSKLPNIMTFSKNEIASGNQVKVLWQTYISSNYIGGSDALWPSPTTFLSAGGLLYEISETATVDDLNNLSNKGLQVDTKIADNYSQYQSLFNFNGYLLVQSEIFEFDAIQYQYVDKADTSLYPTWQNVWVDSDTALSKYIGLSKPGYQDPNKPETAYCRPTGRVRVKARGALATPIQKHTVPGPNALSDWTVRNVTVQA